MATMSTALEAKKKMREILEGLPGVNGIGITWDKNGQPAVQVNVDFEIADASLKKIPASVDGVAVLIQETGPASLE
jgi:hypothetical protein